jgi:hypothetical protein
LQVIFVNISTVQNRVCDSCYNFANNTADLLSQSHLSSAIRSSSSSSRRREERCGGGEVSEEELLRRELDAVNTDSSSLLIDMDSDDLVEECGSTMGSDSRRPALMAASSSAAGPLSALFGRRSVSAAHAGAEKKSAVPLAAAGGGEDHSGRDAELINKFKARKAERENGPHASGARAGGRGATERRASTTASTAVASSVATKGAFSDTMRELVRREQLMSQVAESADQLAEGSREMKSNSAALLEKTRKKASWWGV